jgi:hypothetical protein
MGGKWVHVIELVYNDTEGHCRSCGTVEIYKDASSKTWRCKSARKDTYERTSRHLSPQFHGLTQNEARTMIELIGVCELCGKETDLVVDHDHQTRRIRGVLCQTHNKALGMFGDDVRMLQRAIQYLEEE